MTDVDAVTLVDVAVPALPTERFAAVLEPAAYPHVPDVVELRGVLGLGEAVGDRVRPADVGHRAAPARAALRWAAISVNETLFPTGRANRPQACFTSQL